MSIFGEIKKLKKLKKIKTNEVCQEKYSPFSKIICNDNATIVFISFIFFISFNFPKRKQTMQLLSLSSFIFFISFNFPQKEKYYATGTNEHKRAHETGAQGA